LDFQSYSFQFSSNKRKKYTEKERSQKRAEPYHGLIPVLKWTNVKVRDSVYGYRAKCCTPGEWE